jgi:hypothetical protein
MNATQMTAAMKELKYGQYKPLKMPYVIDWTRHSPTSTFGRIGETERFRTLSEAFAGFKAQRNAYELRVCVLPENHEGGCADCWTALAKRKGGKIFITNAGRAYGLAV